MSLVSETADEIRQWFADCIKSAMLGIPTDKPETILTDFTNEIEKLVLALFIHDNKGDEACRIVEGIRPVIKALFTKIRGDFKEPKRKKRRRPPMPTGSKGDEE